LKNRSHDIGSCQSLSRWRLRIFICLNVHRRMETTLPLGCLTLTVHC
jgi:hypothetical protein